jgi:hypothetical protein
MLRGLQKQLQGCGLMLLLLFGGILGSLCLLKSWVMQKARLIGVLETELMN